MRMLLALAACGLSVKHDTGPDTGAPEADTVLSDTAVKETADSGDPALDTAPPPCPLEADGRLPAVEGDYVPPGAVITTTRTRCQAALHATAGAEGMTLMVALREWTGAAPTLTALDLLGGVVAGPASLAPGSGEAVTLPTTGEFMLRLDPADPDAEADAYTLSVTCMTNCSRAWTRYPIVLMHGMGGTDSFLSVLDYFFGIKDDLAAEGYRVETPAVDALADVETRAAQWKEALDALEAAGAGRRFNLIAHSQGGLDARYLLGGLGDGRAVTLTTVGSPHHGSPIADLAAGVLELDGVDEAAIDAAVAVLAGLVGLDGDDLSGQIADLTTTSMADFNATVPDNPAVAYYSWSGRSCGWLDLDCLDETGGETVDLLLAASYTIIALVEGDNDGMVPTESAIWGEHLGTLSADHLDEIGQLLDGSGGAFDHRAFYSSEAARLAVAGF